MSDGFEDSLWPHFTPLWTDLRAISPGVALTGGYALFLKQRWLASNTSVIADDRGDAMTDEQGRGLIANEVRTIVDLSRWLDGMPRVTKDFDLLVTLEMIASTDDQKRIEDALRKHSFAVVPSNARWQFEKEISRDQRITLDFHALAPVEEQDNLRVEKRRIKPKPSLGDEGIHGRQNPEAVGAHIHPFRFTFDSLEIQVPNPVTLSMMKLIAMRDRRALAQDVKLTAQRRAFEEQQARKHANDLFKVAAMTTREESDRLAEVLENVREAECYRTAGVVFADCFGSADAWGNQVVGASWRPEDAEAIRASLGRWFVLGNE